MQRAVDAFLIISPLLDMNFAAPNFGSRLAE